MNVAAGARGARRAGIRIESRRQLGDLMTESFLRAANSARIYTLK